LKSIDAPHQITQKPFPPCGRCTVNPLPLWGSNLQTSLQEYVAKGLQTFVPHLQRKRAGSHNANSLSVFTPQYSMARSRTTVHHTLYAMNRSLSARNHHLFDAVSQNHSSTVHLSLPCFDCVGCGKDIPAAVTCGCGRVLCCRHFNLHRYLCAETDDSLPIVYPHSIHASRASPLPALMGFGVTTNDKLDMPATALAKNPLTSTNANETCDSRPRAGGIRTKADPRSGLPRKLRRVDDDELPTPFEVALVVCDSDQSSCRNKDDVPNDTVKLPTAAVEQLAAFPVSTKGWSTEVLPPRRRLQL
jgi:hypothetical protein